MQLCREVINALLPEGALWSVEEDGGLDQLLEGIAGNHDRVRLFLHTLARIRHPLYTSVLEDLERDFGIVPDLTLDEATRRARLQVAKANNASDGTAKFLQRALQAAGFEVVVHANDPPVDPALFVGHDAISVMGNGAAIVGGSSMGARNGELLVNGSGDPTVFQPPADPGYWPLFFFVGGEATRNTAGELTNISNATVPAARRAELARMILRYKPMDVWAGMLITYV